MATFKDVSTFVAMVGDAQLSCKRWFPGVATLGEENNRGRGGERGVQEATEQENKRARVGWMQKGKDVRLQVHQLSTAATPSFSCQR